MDVQSVTVVSYSRIAVHQERGHGVCSEGDFVSAAVETVLGEMGRTDRRAEPRVPVRTTDSPQPLGQQDRVVKRKPGRDDE